MKPQVLITQSIPEIAGELLAPVCQVIQSTAKKPLSAPELVRLAPDPVAIISLLSDRIDASFMSSFKNLKLIANYAVGFNNIDLNEAKRRGIMVTNTPGVLTEATADLALGLLLAVTRRLVPADRFCRNGLFTGWEAGLFTGKEIQGGTAGIIGMGKIGQAVARRLRTLGMRVIYHNRNRLPLETESDLGAIRVELDTLLSQSDVVSLHAPLTPETRGMLNADRLNRMKAGAVLINTARGELVDEAELARLIQSGQLYGAGLDVFEHEPAIHPLLLKQDSVVLAPHIGSATSGVRNRMAQLAATAVLMMLDGKEPSNRVI